jgi:hypothetical protein
MWLGSLKVDKVLEIIIDQKQNIRKAPLKATACRLSHS